MMQGIKKQTIIAAIIIFLAAGAAGFFIGKYVEASRYSKEQELNILLNQSELEKLGEIDGTVYVTGHKSPDSDTVCSAIAYASLLDKLGYDAVPVVLGDVNRETEYILKSAAAETPDMLDDASGRTMILVDHSEYAQSSAGLEDANIISIIDHHGDGSVTTGNQLIYDARPLGSTATIIWIRYRNYGVEVDEQTAFLMVGAILSDTINLKSDTTTSADIEAVKALSAIANISDTDAFYQEMHKAALSHEGMTDEEIYHSDYKEYESGGKKYGIGCISVYDEDEAKDMAKRMKEIVSSAPAAAGLDMAFAQISYFYEDGDISVNYLVPSDEAAADVLKEVFPDAEVFDDTSCRIEPGVSRKKVLVPAISDVLEAHPKE